MSAGRQGVGRRLDIDTVQVIDLVAALGRLGIAGATAVSIAERLKDATSGPLEIARGVQLAYDPVAHRADLDMRLREAAERVVQPPRGRPPRGRPPQRSGNR